jgi:hypothetical protein
VNKNGPFVLKRILPTKFDEGLFWLFACACASQGSKILAHAGFCLDYSCIDRTRVLSLAIRR